MSDAQGFIVAAWEAGDRLFFSGRLSDGRSFACATGRGDGAVFVAVRDGGKALSALAPVGYSGSEEWTDMEGKPLLRITLSGKRMAAAERDLAGAGVGVEGTERGRAEDYLAARAIRGPVIVHGEERRGRRVDAVFVEPEMEGSEETVPLRWLALDIETDRAGTVVAVSLVSDAIGDKAPVREGYFLGPATGLDGVRSFPDEASLLAAAAEGILRVDPDVITGWNVIDFDMRVLAARYKANGVPFLIGRTDEAAYLVEKGPRRVVVACPGRAVLDAMRLVRGSGERFDDLRLETVSRNLLGEGKSVADEGEDKLDELDRLRAEDPAAFVSYCIRDSELVLRILAKTGLDRLTQARAGLTGLPLDLAWTSIPAFERVYAAGLRARRVAVPRREERAVSGAAGGTVLDPIAGLFEGVLVFDFRSLYPSLMRTFNIDPLAHARALSRPVSQPPEPGEIVAPNGARFDAEPGILPAIIARYAAEREMALAAGDETAAYVYKILQNSFYGVLGAEGCRYARTELAGAVTSFGRKFLVAARDFFEARGYRTLYGDTDSVFVESGLGASADYAALSALGASLAEALNAELADSVRSEYGRESFLRIRCEKIYRRFFIPRLRIDPEAGGGRGRAFLPASGAGTSAEASAEAGQEGADGPCDHAAMAAARGRAKGYAGLRLEADGKAAVEVKGMEAARSDWTPLARSFQVTLLGLAFGGDEGRGAWASAEELTAYCNDVSRALRRGELDSELVYRKMLRRPPEEYASETPQVRAARLLGMEGRRGSVSFVMTRAGSEPVSRRSGSPLDYDHYVEHQLLPIAKAVADALSAMGDTGLTGGSRSYEWDVERWFADRPQMELDFAP
jgi:DNA polymerase-2